MFSKEQKTTLVALARDAVAGATRGLREPAMVTGEFPVASGAFVTLKLGGRLRGCIGTLECRRSLAEEVMRVAVSAACEDPRFSPLTAAELEGLHVEVSVLGPLEEIDPH